jgi:hypothetical protein
MRIDDRISALKEWEAGKAFLELLIQNEDLNGNALEITKQVIAKGEDSLTPRQRCVFERDVLRIFNKPCEGCDRNIPWNEKYDAYHDRDGFCFDCYDEMTRYRDE